MTTASGTASSWTAAAGVRDALAALSPRWAERLGEDVLLTLDTYRESGQNALTPAGTATDAAPLGATAADGLPNTFVPGP